MGIDHLFSEIVITANRQVNFQNQQQRTREVVTENALAEGSNATGSKCSLISHLKHLFRDRRAVKL